MTKIEERQMWESRVSDFRSSGLSGPQWCAANGVKIHQLRYWTSRFRSTEKKPADRETQWLSVELEDLRSSRQSNVLPIRVGKATIEVSPGFDPDLLSDVVKTLAVL